MIVIYLALYLSVFIFDILPLVKAKRKKTLFVYLPVFLLTLTVNILYALGMKIPSPAEPVRDAVVRIFGVK